MLIAAASLSVEAPGQPPALLPKPGKDNLRLQKLLRKAGRRATGGLLPPGPPRAFRTRLSPVSETSHDQDTAAPHAPISHRVASPLQPLNQPGTPTSDPRGDAPACVFRPLPLAGSPEPSQVGPEKGPIGQEPGTASSPHGDPPLVPVAHIRPLPTAAQAAQPLPKAPTTPRPPPGFRALVSRAPGTRVVVPIAPTYHSPHPSPHRPSPGGPEGKCLLGSSPDRGSEAAPSPASGPPPGSVPATTPRPGLRGWTRLRKQLLEEPAEAASLQPEPGPLPRPLSSRASQLWDAVMYRMLVAESRDQPSAPAGARLPFLCRPRFNARKLQAASARPPPVWHPVMERGPQPRNFNRVAAGWGPQ